MAPGKASKASGEVSRQGSDNASDTSPRGVDSVRTRSYVSEVLQSVVVNCSEDSLEFSLKFGTFFIFFPHHFDLASPRVVHRVPTSQ